MKGDEGEMSAETVEKRAVVHLAWFLDIGLMHGEALLRL